MLRDHLQVSDLSEMQEPFYLSPCICMGNLRNQSRYKGPSMFEDGLPAFAEDLLHAQQGVLVFKDGLSDSAVSGSLPSFGVNKQSRITSIYIPKS